MQGNHTLATKTVSKVAAELEKKVKKYQTGEQENDK